MSVGMDGDEVAQVRRERMEGRRFTPEWSPVLSVCETTPEEKDNLADPLTLLFPWWRWEKWSWSWTTLTTQSFGKLFSQSDWTWKSCYFTDGNRSTKATHTQPTAWEVFLLLLRERKREEREREWNSKMKAGSSVSDITIPWGWKGSTRVFLSRRLLSWNRQLTKKHWHRMARKKEMAWYLSWPQTERRRNCVVKG